MEDEFEEMPYWKRVWQTVSGICESATEDDVNQLLTSVRERLVDGLTLFRPYNGINEPWTQFIGIRHELNRIVRKLAITTDVEIILTWTIFCNYLTFDFHGRPEDLIEVGRSEIRLAHLVEKYEHFYTMERMYLLKTLHHMLRNHDNTDCRLRHCFDRFVSENSVFIIRRSLWTQFHVLHLTIQLERGNMQINSDNRRVIRCVNEVKQLCVMMVASSWGRFRRVYYGAGEVGIELQPLMLQLMHMMQGFNYRRYGMLEELTETLSPLALKDLHYAHLSALIVPMSELWNNFPLWEVHREQIDRIYLEGRVNQKNDYRTIFTMQWSLLLITNPMEYDRAVNFIEQHRTHIQEALQRGVLQLLADFCNSQFLDSIEEGSRVRRAIYRYFQEVYVLLDSDEGLYGMPGLAQLLAALMRDRMIGLDILNGENEIGLVPQLKLNRIIGTVEDLFPFDFTSFSVVMHAMMHIESFQELAFVKLKNRKLFVEAIHEDSSRFVLSDYKPFETNVVVAPAQQEALELRRRRIDCLSYNTHTYGYFDILELLMENYIRREVDRTGHVVTSDEYCTAVLSGLHVMMDIFDYEPEYRTNPGFWACMNHVLLVVRYNVNHCYHHEVTVTSLRLCVRMLEFVPDKVVSYLRGIRIIPSIYMDHYSTEVLLSLRNLLFGSNLLTIVEKDIIDFRGDVIEIFIDMIQYGIRSGKFYSKMQAPLTVFLFQRLFALFQLNHFHYCEPGPKIRAIARIVDFINQILLMHQNMTGKQERLRNQILEMMMSNWPFICAFMYIVVQNPNVPLEVAVTHNQNWTDIVSFSVMKIAKQCVSILLLLIREAGDCGLLVRRPFGAALMNTRPDSVDHIKILASWINNSFDPALREASCRLLTRFAQNPGLTILAHLDLDSYQVRNLFLEKLRDPLEKNTMKVAVIDFIATSVTCQNALTSAFFNFPKYMEDTTLDLSDNVSSFIIEHLENVKRFPELRSSPMQQSILNLLEQIWMRGIEIVMMPLMNTPNFWDNLAAPLFEEFQAPHISYCHIINIFANQIHVSWSAGRRNPCEFLLLLRNMFKPRDESFILRTLNYVRNILLRPEQTEWMLLYAIKNFIFVTSSQKPELYRDELKSDLAFALVKGLWEYMNNPYDNCVIEMYMSSYIHLMCVWGKICFAFYETDTINLVTDIVNQFAIHFNSMSAYGRSTVLCMVCNLITHLKDIINEEPKKIWELLKSVRRIIEIQERVFHLDDGRDKQFLNQWTFLIIFAGQILDLECVEEFRTWFCNGSFFKYVMMTASKYMAKKETLTIAKIAMQTLITYVKKNMHGKVSQEDLEMFYRKGHPPRNFIDFRPFDPKVVREWPFEEFWTTYLVLVQYNTTLLQHEPRDNFPACMSFFVMHWEVIESILKLPTMTVEMSALTLVQTLLNLGCEMLDHKDEWYQSDLGPKITESFFIMVRVVINSCIQLMISPNIIKFFTKFSLYPLNVEDVSDDVYVGIMDQVLAILTTACACQNKASPSHLQLMSSDSNKRMLIAANAIDADFSIPKISSNINTKLTYGDLLYLHQIMVQILYKTHTKSRAAKPDAQPPAVDIPGLDDSFSTIELRKKIDKERKQRHKIKKSIETTPLTGQSRAELFALVCPDFVHRNVTDWSTRRMHEPDVSGMSAPWLGKLSEPRTLCAIEALTCLLGTEIHTHMTTYVTNSTELLYYRRHFCTELQMFHDYVRKWRCGDVSLGELMATLSYHWTNQLASAFAARRQSQAHASLVPPRVPLLEPTAAEIFNVLSPIPDIFNEWRRDVDSDEIFDHFFDPVPPVGADKESKTPQLDNQYLLMLSYWLHFVCTTND